MKAHRVIYALTIDLGVVERAEYFSSEGAASKRCTELRKDTAVDGKPERESLEIPTNRDGLLEWLNLNAYLQAPI